ncbi:MAG: hypothetical protein ABI688_02160 [Bacteroidota bacterium]
MKLYYLPLLFFILTGCNRSATNTRQLQARIDSLEQKLSATYKPGFGEFMSGIQVHHAKLWFAGINNNWELANFEVHEIMEALDDLQTFQTERKETKNLPMLNPALDSVNKAIQEKNAVLFKNSFILLTATCNNCHKAVEFSFNEVKIPETPPFSNQVFTKKGE